MRTRLLGLAVAGALLLALALVARLRSGSPGLAGTAEPVARPQPPALPATGPRQEGIGARTSAAAQAEPEREATLALRVLAASAGPGRGQPVAGARVALARAGSPEVELHSVASAGEGRCVLAGIEPGEVVIRASAPGYLDCELIEIVQAGSAELTLPLLARGERMHGRVIDPDGAPLAGALVALDTRSGPGRRFRRDAPGPEPAPPHAWTDASGEFELFAPAHASRLALLVCPARPGLAPIVRRDLGASGQPREVVVRIASAFPIVFRMERADGTPASGRLSLSAGASSLDPGGDGFLRRIPGFARDHGRAPVPGSLALDLPEGGYTLLYHPEASASAPQSFFVAVSAGGPREIRLEVQDG